MANVTYTGVDDVRIMFPVGSRVVVTDSGCGVETGTHGTVIEVNDANTIHVDWEGFRGHSVQEGGSHTGHCYHVNPEYIRLDTVITEPVIPGTPPRIPRVRVTIARNHNTYGNPWNYRIENGPQVTKDEVKQYLDKGISRRIGVRTWRNDLQTIVDRAINTYGIDPQVMIDAIMAAVIAKQAREQTGTFSSASYDSDISQMVATQPMIVAIGDQIFTLQPKGHINATRAMGIIRDRITKVAKESGERIKTVAKSESAGMIANAERQLRDARAKIEEERKALKLAIVIPPWVAANRLKIRNYNSDSFPLAVGMEISTKIIGWQLLRYETEGAGNRKKIVGYNVKWTGSSIPSLRHYKNITVWLPFNPTTGAFYYPKAYISDDDGGTDYLFPHITYRCCMTLQGMPLLMTDIVEYKKIKAIISRGNQEVNLMSLLSGVNGWHPDVYNQMPTNVKTIMTSTNYNLDTFPAELMADAVKTRVDEEAKGTFNIDSMAESRRARGESLTDVVMMPVEDALIETDTEPVEDR